MGSESEQSQKVVEMLKNHQTTMLVTHDIEGGLVSRPMTVQSPEFDGVVWFFVSDDADVITEIEANSEVNVAYSDDDNYLSLSGQASVVDDEAQKKSLWYSELKKWFDGAGPGSSKVRLIKVEIDTARYWNLSPDQSREAGSDKQKSPIDTGKIKYN